MDEKMVTISEERYKVLLEESAKYQMLEEFGVDNWEYYSEAMAEMKETPNDAA